MYIQLTLLSTVLVAMAAFALRAILSDADAAARIKKQGSSPFLGNLPMEFAYWILSPLGRLAAALKLSPNIFSWTCLGLGTLAGTAAALGQIPMAGGLAIVSALFDALDGIVARSRGVASDAGEVLDAAIDRYTEFFFLAGLCIYYRFEPWAMVLVLGALLGSFLVSYSQAKAEALQTPVPRGWMRRPERATYLGAGAFLSPIVTIWLEEGLLQPMHYPLLVAVLLVGIFSNATAIQRFVVLYRALRSK